MVPMAAPMDLTAMMNMDTGDSSKLFFERFS